MYKNQLQELAQRSCFNLPSYTCIREGPDHAPRFKATVNFNGEVFESPSFCTTLRQAEHSAAEVALTSLSSQGPSHSLAARILDETGVYKNLLQEVSQRVGAALPIYTTFRSGHGHLTAFSCTVELAGVRFTGEPAKNKKQAEKNAAMAAWSSLKLLQQSEGSSSDKANIDEQEHVTVARALQNFLWKAKMLNVSLPIKFPVQNPKPLSTTQPPPTRTSKILPFIFPNTAPRTTRVTATVNEKPIFPAARAAPYIPVRHFRAHQGIAPPVTIRNAIPVFSAPPLPPPSRAPQLLQVPPPVRVAPPVCIKQAVPAFSPPVCVEEQPISMAASHTPATTSSSIKLEKRDSAVQDTQQLEAVVVEHMEEMKI
ncbi:double-stranded RNA-binding protein 2-like isoform X2 [Rhododendron vialii]|uniref:double-stranded RNA-binding protein 2-like isoform X2 n=1 Tax=Rhododendron vialii TaxID=182163 RepID=UPI00265F7D36|nr:double-stranded RNA-binding protein 2-like isoform X2 [Rhododendron vialii]